MVVFGRLAVLRVLVPAALVQLSTRRVSAAVLAPAAALAALRGDLQTLGRVGDLLDDAKRWPEAAALLAAPAFETSTLAAVFDAYTTPVTAKETLMCAAPASPRHAACLAVPAPAVAWLLRCGLAAEARRMSAQEQRSFYRVL